MNHLSTKIDVERLLEQDLHLVHSFQNLDEIKQTTARTMIVSADGTYVTDSSGTRLIDGIGGLWCVNVGHGRREIIEAVYEQLKKLDYYSTFYNLTHPLAAELAEKITSLAPGNLNKVYFGNSGSVANESAVRILHHHNNRLGLKKKKKILTRIGAYHGSTHLAMAMTNPGYREGWDSAEELVHFLRNPNPYRREDGETVEEFHNGLIDNMVSEIEKIGAENIAAFIAEPVMGAGGVIVPPHGYHKRTRDVCTKYDIKYISDEVVTAFGRVGHMFASKDEFGIQPDIITTAKGLTSGYQPMGATIMSDEIYEVISRPGAMFRHGVTYSGHPACCAAALANIAILENEKIPQHVQKSGPKFEAVLHALDDLEIVGDVRGKCFMMGVEFVRDKKTKAPFATDVRMGPEVAKQAQKRGLIVRAIDDMIVLSPPLILTEDEIENIGNTLRASIVAAMQELQWR